MQPQTSPASPTIRVWDPVVRVFHWGLAAAFAIAYLTAEEMEQVHVVAGYVIGGLIAVRVVWGFVGPRHARFTDFIFGPTAIFTYLRDLVSGRPKRFLGHSPAGGAMVVALLIAITVTCVTGLLMGPGEGSSGEAFEELHEVAAALSLGLVLAHIAGVLLASFVHRENLPLAMITGRKQADHDDSTGPVAP